MADGDTSGYASWIAAKIGLRGRELTGEALAGYQLDKLGSLIDYLRANSPFYRKHLEKCGPSRLTSLSDLERFPFTTVGDVHSSGLKMVCVNQGEISHVVTLATSGTTGTPKQLYFTRQDQELTVDMFRRSMSQLTGEGEIVHVLLPAARPGSVGDLLALAIEKLGAEAVKCGPVENLPVALESLIARPVTCLVGLPTQVLALAKYYQATGERRGLRLREILLCTDHVPRAIKDQIAGIWGCRVLGYYGTTEAGFGGGMECPAGGGYHLHEADLHFEIVDPASGRPVPEGEEGEVVISTLTRRGMPLLRYRTGDLSRFIPGACPCGSVLRRMATIRARKNGFVRIGGGCRLTMADLDEALFPLPGVVDFSATVLRAADNDRLRIVVDSLNAGTSQDMVRSSLDGISSVHKEVESGALVLEISGNSITESIAGKVDKRIIRALESLGDLQL